MAKCMLVVAAKPEIARKVRTALEPHGYVVEEAADTDVANAQVRLSPALLILAPSPPHHESLAYEDKHIKRLGGSNNAARPRVFVLLAQNRGEVMTEWNVGADGYLTERFVPAELPALVRCLIGPAEE